MSCYRLLLPLLSECLDKAELILKVLSDNFDMLMLLLPSIESLIPIDIGYTKVCLPSKDEELDI